MWENWKCTKWKKSFHPFTHFRYRSHVWIFGHDCRNGTVVLRYSSSGEYTLGTIAGGIYVKMITSATGLIIGLLAYVGYNFLNAQIDKNVNRMEAASAGIC